MRYLCGESTTSFSFQFMLAFEAVGADAFAIAQDADDKKRHNCCLQILDADRGRHAPGLFDLNDSRDLPLANV